MRTIEWKGNAVYFIDQTKLPRRLILVKCSDHTELARAIKNMEIRGAPALGVAAAMGIALAAKNSKGKKADEIKSDLVAASKLIRSTRPTARNLFWALERMERVWRMEKDPSKLVERVVREAVSIADEDVQLCRAIGRHGAELIHDGDNILTHCNAGGLACVEYGTALGVIRSAVASGKKVFVYATETRPLLQGARLTAFELKSERIPFKLITDSMVGYVMQKGLVDKVIVGADRIIKSGDVINKIGTYGIAALARVHGVPFYVAAPSSTIDLLVGVEEIIIEERKAEEVTIVCGKRIAPKGTDVLNPAFDLTPKELVNAIITEKGVAYPPYDLSVLLGKS